MPSRKATTAANCSPNPPLPEGSVLVGVDGDGRRAIIAAWLIGSPCAPGRVGLSHGSGLDGVNQDGR